MQYCNLRSTKSYVICRKQIRCFYHVVTGAQFDDESFQTVFHVLSFYKWNASENLEQYRRIPLIFQLRPMNGSLSKNFQLSSSPANKRAAQSTGSTFSLVVTWLNYHTANMNCPKVSIS